MEIINIHKTSEFENPNPDSRYMQEVLTEKHSAKNFGGISVIIPPGEGVSYHYHQERESIIIIISGEATEILEGQKYPIETGDIIFIPAGEKHGIDNTSDKELRFIEFFTNPPVSKDRIEVEN